jgi:hypothetical protein
MPIVSMKEFLVLCVNGANLANVIGQTIRLIGKVTCQVFEDEDIEMMLEMPDLRYVRVIKCGVSAFHSKAVECDSHMNTVSGRVDFNNLDNK